MLTRKTLGWQFHLDNSNLQQCTAVWTDGASNRGQNEEGTEFWGYVVVRPGAHMFYWLYHSFHVDGYLTRPLVIWLQVSPTRTGLQSGFVSHLPANLNSPPHLSDAAVVRPDDDTDKWTNALKSFESHCESLILAVRFESH